MKNKRYLRYLNRHQREVYQYHCWHNSYGEVVDWCEQTFGSRNKRWQAKYFGYDASDSFAYKTLYMFRSHSDAVLFTLKWGGR